MPYVERVTRAGKTIEVERYFTSRYKKPGIKRGDKVKPTKEEQKKVNTRAAERKLRLLLNANFGYGDYHLELDYMKNKGECAMSKEQEEMQQATEEHIEQPLPDEPKEEQSEPMGILTSRAHEDMTLAILQVQAAYGLPAYLTDLIVTAVLADIRGCANKDLLNALSRKE